MKKLYTKPEIMFESFTLSTNIAGDCDIKINNPTEGVCAYIIQAGGRTHSIFTSEISGCKTTQDNGDYNGICYDVPIGGTSLFNS